MHRLGWVLSGVLAVIIAAMTYVFVLPDSPQKAEDGRAIIMLAPSERDFVLAEMRGFLETLEAMTRGLADGDMQAVAASARSRGLENEGDAPASIVAKLPWAFKSLAMDTHRAFDALAEQAEQAEQGSDRQTLLSGLGDLMSNCTTCHAGYRFDIESEEK